MNVLSFAYFFPPAYSGEATYIQELALGLLASGHKVRVIAACPPEANTTAPEWVSFVMPPQVSRVDDFELFRKLFTESLLQAAHEVVDGINWDIVHVQEWFCAEAALKIARRLGVPLVKTLHFLPPEKLISTMARWHLADMWQHRSCLDADELIAVGSDLKEEAVARYELKLEKISVVHNSVNPDSLKEIKLPDEFLCASEQNRPSPLIVCVARLVEQKGIDLLLKSIPTVLKEHPSAKWTICGGGPAQGGIPSSLLDAASGFDGAVRFTGHLPRLEALGWVAASDVMVAPSRFEPFGLCVLEAMLLGKPIIASEVGGIREMIKNNFSGILVATSELGDGWKEVDPVQLARAQLTVLSSRSLAKKLGEQAQSDATKRFAYSDFISNTVAVFDRAAARNAKQNRNSSRAASQ